jgi:hypothetical protein
VADGRLVAGQHDTYHGNQPLAYGCDPAENVVFNGCHDNETIFDQVRYITRIDSWRAIELKGWRGAWA